MDPFDVPLTVIVRPIETTSWFELAVSPAIAALSALVGAFLGAWLVNRTQQRIYADQTRREQQRAAHAAFVTMVSVYETAKAIQYYNRRSRQALLKGITGILISTEQDFRNNPEWVNHASDALRVVSESLNYTKPRTFIDIWGISTEERILLSPNYLQKIVEIKFVLDQLVRMHDDRVADIAAFTRYADSPQRLHAYLRMMIERTIEAHDRHGYAEHRMALFVLRTELVMRWRESGLGKRRPSRGR